MIGDFDSEIERLKAKRAEINSKISSTRNFDTKEKLKEELARIENQIKILENFKRRTS
jgi:peptidoglycan hydrolase CwlO-like protein